MRQYQSSWTVVAGAGSQSRVLRGGAFWNDHQNVRCAQRNRNDARNVNNNIGFRVALAGPTYGRVSSSRRGFLTTLPGRDAIWPSLFLAAPGPSQAGHIATALHPGHSTLVRGSQAEPAMYAQLVPVQLVKTEITLPLASPSQG